MADPANGSGARGTERTASRDGADGSTLIPAASTQPRPHIRTAVTQTGTPPSHPHPRHPQSQPQPHRPPPVRPASWAPHNYDYAPHGLLATHDLTPSPASASPSGSRELPGTPGASSTTVRTTTTPPSATSVHDPSMIGSTHTFYEHQAQDQSQSQVQQYQRQLQEEYERHYNDNLRSGRPPPHFPHVPGTNFAPHFAGAVPQMPTGQGQGFGGDYGGQAQTGYGAYGGASTAGFTQGSYVRAEHLPPSSTNAMDHTRFLGLPHHSASYPPPDPSNAFPYSHNLQQHQQPPQPPFDPNPNPSPPYNQQGFTPISEHGHPLFTTSPTGTGWPTNPPAAGPSSSPIRRTNSDTGPTTLSPVDARPQPHHVPPNPPIERSSTARPRGGKKRASEPHATRGRKRPKHRATERERESESESEDENGAEIRFAPPGVGGAGLGGGPMMPTRLPGACTHCKKLKMKCNFQPGEGRCDRCRSGNHPCIVEGRKPRTAPNKREFLLTQIRQKEQIIESLLKRIHNPYLATPQSIRDFRMAAPDDSGANANVLAWLERLEASVPAFHPPVDGISHYANRDQLQGQNPGFGGERTNLAIDVPAINEEGVVDIQGPSSGESGELGMGTLNNGLNDLSLDSSIIPDPAAPLGVIAGMALRSYSARASSRGSASGHEMEDGGAADDDKVGVANETYFVPGPAMDMGMRASMYDRHSPPEILVHGLVTVDDVDELFKIFYTRINPFISLLDPVLHTPASTFARCPFLFTVVCAICSRYYEPKSAVYAIAMHFAKSAAANALTDGWKSVELCQAYILLSIYAVPAKRWEEDRSWLYTGLAIRIATDLNLHKSHATQPRNEQHQREILNRTRTWLICFNLDRSTATQFGKPTTIKEDYVVRHSVDWYKSSPINHPYDLHLCAYTAQIRIVSDFHDAIFSNPDSPTGLNTNADFRTITAEYDDKLSAYFQEWDQKFKDDSDPDDPACRFRCTLLPYYVNYSRLVMHSFGFQQAFQRGFTDTDKPFFRKCFDSATGVLRLQMESLAPSGYLRFGADGHFVFGAFASAFLMKLLRPEFEHLMTKQEQTDVVELIGRLITMYSNDIAIDERHTPKLYARFLAGLLQRQRPDGSSSGRMYSYPPGGRNNSPAFDPQASHHAGGSMSHVFPVSSQGLNLGGGGGGGGSGAVTGTGAGTGGSAFGTMHPGMASGSGSGTQSQLDTPTAEIAEPALGPSSSHAQGQSQSLGAVDATPVYVPDTAYLGSGPLNLSPVAGYGYGFPDEYVPPPMLALKSPAWWDNMMMPGFSWPEPMQGVTTATASHQNTFGGGGGGDFSQQGWGLAHGNSFTLETVS